MTNSPVSPERIVCIFGEEYFLIHQQEHTYTTTFLATESDMNLTILDGATTTVPALMSACEAMPFLGTRRLVLVRHADLTRLADLAPRLPDIPTTCQLILVCTKADKRTALYKALQKQAVMHECLPLKAPEFSAWVRTRAATHSVTLTPDALQLLTRYTIGNCQTADTELTKLALYSTGEPLTAADIRLLVPRSTDESVFALTDALSARDIRLVFRELQDLITQGESILGLLALLVRQVRILLGIQSLLASGVAKGDIATQLSLHPFVVTKALPQAARFRESELITLLTDFQCIESAIKHGTLTMQTHDTRSVELAVERALLQLTL